MTKTAARDESRRHSRLLWRLAPFAALLFAFVGSAGATSPNVSVSIVSPSNGQTVSGSVVWSAATSGTVSRVDFAVDGTVKWSEANAPYVYNGDGNKLDTTTLADGTHTLSVTAYGRANRTASASVSVLVSNAVTTPPPPPPPAPLAVSTASPANGSTVSGNITWQANVTSGTASRVDFAIDGSLEWTEHTAPYVFNGDGHTLDTTTLTNASHALAVTAVAADGTTATSTVTVNVSNAAPTPPTGTPPTSSALPVISGTPVVGQTLTASTGAWSGSPTSYGYQWQLCDATGAACSAVAGATTASHIATSTDQGHALRVTVTTSNAYGSGSATSAATSTVQAASSSPTGTSTFESNTAYLNTARPDLSNAVVVSSAAQFASAMSSATAGKTYDVLGNVQIPGEFTGWNRVVTGGVVNVVFEPGASFTGGAGTQLPAVWVQHSGGWRIWGGTITNPVGGGVLFYTMPGPFTWTGFTVGQTAGGGVGVFPVGGNISGLTLAGVAGSSSPNLSFDPHVEKGTGIHAWNIADATGGIVENSTFAADTLNQATGAAVEIETNRVSNVVVYARAQHLGFAIPGTTWTGDAQSQVAGNVIQLWGGSAPGRLDIRYAEGNNIQGRILETNGVASGSDLSQVSVDYGRATGTILQNPLLSKIAYAGKGGLVLGNVLPLP